MALEASSVQRQLLDSQPDRNVLITVSSSQVRTICCWAPGFRQARKADGAVRLHTAQQVWFLTSRSYLMPITLVCQCSASSDCMGV